MHRICGGKTRSVQGWTLIAQLGQLKTVLGEKGLVQSHLWCPTTSQGYGIDKTRLEYLEVEGSNRAVVAWAVSFT